MRRSLPILLAVLAAASFSLAVPPAHAVHAAPPALPSDRLHFGLSNSDVTWMTGSGVPWRYRFQYLAGGANTNSGWSTWNSPAGAFATYYMQASTAAPANYISVFTYYQLLQSTPSTGANESDRDFSNLNNASTMQAYYGDFKLLMQKIGAFSGGPVVVQVEPDLWGYLQQRAHAGGATTADALTASVAGSGFPEASGYANTAQGFARVLVHLRDVYAPNAVLGVHASMWSSGIDLATSTDPNLNAAGEADKTATFLNSTASWDLVFNDVDDHNAGWWEMASCGTPPCVNQWWTHWWDPQNAAFPNFARYLSWVSELHSRTARPQVAWQVPMGNQYFLTENNTCGHYQDNVAAYFISHAADLTAAGLIAVMFGAGNACQTSNEDGQHDGVTNNNGTPTSDALGGCSACNAHSSTVVDDDGGFLRTFVGQYYSSLPAAFTAYFTWYDRISSPGFLADDIHIVNPNGSPVSVSLSIPGSPGCYLSDTVPAGQDRYFSCASGFGGPVVLRSSARVLASQRVQYFQSFNEVPAQPSSAAATSFYFSWFDRASSPGFLADNIHIINPSSSTAVVQVGIPGCAVQTSSLPAGGSTYASCPNTIGGPVSVRSTNGVGILTSQRVQYFGSFNEVAGQAAAAASTSLFFSWFDRISSAGFKADNIHLVNPNSTTANVTVAIPGCGPQAVQVPPTGYQIATCGNGFGGPVTVSSTNGVGVLASQRVQYYDSFNEVAAQPANAAKASLYLSWFDRASSPGFLADNVHVINPSGSPAAVTVSIPGCGPQLLQVAAGSFQVATCSSGFGGPVTVTTTNSAGVLASQRVQYYQSFNEVLASG